MEAMAKHHTYSIEFKRQVAQEYIAGETLHALAKRHDLSRNLIRGTRRRGYVAIAADPTR
jgi:transposase